MAPIAIPSPTQLIWHDCEIGMFIHFAPNTWQDREGDNLSTPLDEIDPSLLDTEQWVDVAESMGAKYIVFVAKHVGGFCMWRTETTKYSIANTPFRGGQGDVLAELAATCRRRGMKLGVYLSPRDDTHHIAASGKAKNPKEQEAYNQLYRQQLTEILTGYGDIFELWFDGNIRIPVLDIIEKYSPDSILFQGPRPSIRWIGSETGLAPYPAWNSVPSHLMKEMRTLTIKHSRKDGNLWLPFECDVPIRGDWFWNTKNESTLKTLDHLMDIYYRSVGHGTVLLLNHNPDRTGLIPETDVQRAAEFGAEILRRFGQSIAETSGEGETLEITFDQPTFIDHVIMMEDIQYGERIHRYRVEGFAQDKWTKLSRGTAIGHKKIDRFNRKAYSKVRVRVIESVELPIFRRFAAFDTEK